jgi:hypothetical protein
MSKDCTGVLFTTSKFATTTAFAHSESLDGLAVKRGEVGQGFSNAVTAAETNYTGKINGRKRVVGMAVHLRPASSADLGDAAIPTELEDWLNKMHIEIKHADASGGTNIESVGPALHWPSPMGRSGEDQSTGATSNMGNGASVGRIARFAQPLIFEDQDTPRIQYKPAATTFATTKVWEIQTVLLVEPA